MTYCKKEGKVIFPLTVISERCVHSPETYSVRNYKQVLQPISLQSFENTDDNTWKKYKGNTI